MPDIKVVSLSKWPPSIHKRLIETWSNYLDGAPAAVALVIGKEHCCPSIVHVPVSKFESCQLFGQ